jgi:subtilisin-like proprotein convertase family protein
MSAPACGGRIFLSRTFHMKTRITSLFALLLLLMPLSALGQKEQPDRSRQLLIGMKQPSAEEAARAVRQFGVLYSKDRHSGMYIATIRDGHDLEEVKARLLARPGIDYVLPASSTDVTPGSYYSVRDHILYLRTAKALNNDLELEDVSVGYYRSLEFFLSLRVGPDGQLDVDAYDRAVQHREQMPPARGEVGALGVQGNWQYVGPRNLDVPYRTYYGVRPTTGRINAVRYDPNNPNRIFVASAGGGIWRTTNGGTNWTPLSDNWEYLYTSSIAIDKNNSNIIYAGTGDFPGSTPYTMGLMKSTDGGNTWTNYGRSQFGLNAVSGILIDPDNSQIVTITTGRGSNGGQGRIWRSTNGGVTWTQTNAPASNWCEIDVSAPGAGGARTYWAVGSGSGGGRIYRSADRGATWTQVASPDAVTQSTMDVACSKINHDTVYVLATGNNKIYKTTNNGATWQDITAGFPTGNNNYNWSQKTYDYHIGTSRNGTQDAVYVGLITIAMSPNGGSSWVDIGLTYTNQAKTHNDQHCFDVHPTNPNEVLLGHDGGVFRSVFNPSNNTATMTGLNVELYVTQFYAMALHPSNMNFVMGGTQDNASPASRGDLQNWRNLYAGDGGWCAFDHVNPNIEYTTSQSLSVYRYVNGSLSTITPSNKVGAAFIAPVILGNNPADVYAGDRRLLKWVSGTNWTASQDLAGSGRSVIYLASCPSDDNRIYTGSSDGQVWTTPNKGGTFTRIDGGTPALPGRAIGGISPSPTNATDVLVGVKGQGWPRLFRCTNVNAVNRAWNNVGGSGTTALPDVPVNAIARDPDDPENTWYVGNDIGVFMTTNAGQTWTNATQPLGLPNVRVNDLKVNRAGTHLYAATWGRGIWRIQLGQPATFKVAGRVTDGGAGMPNVTVSLNQMVDTPHTESTSPGSPIPDNNTTGIEAPLVMPISQTITGVRVGVDITHTFIGDLEVSIIHPDGTTVILHNRTGGGTQNLVTSYPDLSTPNQSLNVLNGKNSQGTWKLRVRDLAAQDVGTLNSFSVTVIYAAEQSLTTVMTNSLGNYEFPSVGAGTYRVRPTFQGRTFTPPFRGLTVGPDALNQNFTADTAAVLTNLTLNPTSVVGGNPTTGTVHLSGAAPTGGVTVSLQSGSSAIQVPASVVVPAGATTANFTANTSQVGAVFVRNIRATLGEVSLTAELTLLPNSLLDRITISPDTIPGGASTTGTVHLIQAAPQGGVTVSLRSESGAIQVPETVTVLAGQTSRNFTITTSPVGAQFERFIYATLGNVTRAAKITLTQTPILNTFEVIPSTVEGGSDTTGRLTLAAPAPAGGATVQIVANTSVIEVPPTVQIPAGVTVHDFTIKTKPVGAVFVRQVYATLASITKVVNVTLIPGVNLTDLTVNPSTVKGGNPTTATVTIGSPAPVGGVEIQVVANSGVLIVPPSVTIPAGQTSVNFTVQTRPVGDTFVRTITASRNGISKTASITLTP